MMKCTTFSDTCVAHNKARFSRMPFNTLRSKVDCDSMSMYNSVYTCEYTASSAWRARLCVGCWYARRLSQSHSSLLLLVDFSLILINGFPREHSGRTANGPGWIEGESSMRHTTSEWTVACAAIGHNSPVTFPMPENHTGPFAAHIETPNNGRSACACMESVGGSTTRYRPNVFPPLMVSKPTIFSVCTTYCLFVSVHFIQFVASVYRQLSFQRAFVGVGCGCKIHHIF